MNTTTRSLSSAQISALHKFAQHGGHGYGEFSFISKSTARVLDRRGFVALSYERHMPWGHITAAGAGVLAVFYRKAAA